MNIPDVNYDESKVPDYVLPDMLSMGDGTLVDDARMWMEQRRPQILRLFEAHVYGRTPKRSIATTFDVTAVDRDALHGLGIRKEIALHLGSENNGPTLNILLYLPKHRSGPAPAFVGLNFFGNHTIHTDTGITLPDAWMREDEACGVVDHRATEAGRGCLARRWPVEKILARGYALVTAYYGDLDPDYDDGFQNGVHPLVYRPGQTAPGPDEWGAIGAWAWGLSRIMDYLEADADIDHRRVAVMGHSRLGKTALWAGAQDQRFALVISNDSGCGGAALFRRRFGETIAVINALAPHWFCQDFRQYDHREDDLPVDQHMLIGLMAPRPVYVASASNDLWADPRGEFLAIKRASPAYQLLGLPGLAADDMPAPGRPITGVMGYHVRPGGHDVTDYDWDRFLDFADRHLP
jgi:hypothetical protein